LFTLGLCLLVTAVHAQPVNDACADAIPIASGETLTGTTVDATPDTGLLCGDTDAPAVWYSMTGDGTPCTASLCGSAFDTKLSVHSGSCDALVCVTSNDDACGLQSEVAWDSVAGETYYIRVFGYGENSGEYTLNLTCGYFEGYWEFNDDLSASTGQVDLEPVGHPGAPGAPSVTYETQSIGGADATAARLSDGTALIVRHGTPANGGGDFVNDYTLVMDVNFPAVGEWMSLYQTNGNIPLDGGNDGDWFVNPDGGIGIGGNYGGTLEANTWYRLALVVNSATGNYRSYIDGTMVQENAGAVAVDGRFGLYTAASEPNFFFLFADETGPSEMGEVLINSACFLARPLNSAELCTLGGPTADGITVPGTECPPPPPPANDLCADAEDLGELPENEAVVVSNQTITATFDDVGECGTTNTAPGVWYRVVTTCDGGRFVGSLCHPDTDYDTKISVFTGSCDALECIDGNDDLGAACDLSTLRSGFDIPTVAGREHWILVHGFSAATGNFTLTLTQACECDPAVANDVCTGAEPLTFDADGTVTISATTIGDCIFPDPENANCGASTAPGVWYSVVGEGIEMSASTCNQADFDTKLSVFAGDCGALSCVAENDDNGGLGCGGFTSHVTWVPEDGVTYYILAHGYSSSEGNFDLTVTAISPPCLVLDSCRSNHDDKTVTLSWSTNQPDDVTGYDVVCNGEVVASLGAEETTYTHTPDLLPGCINVIDYSIVGQGLEGCTVSCVATMSPGSVAFWDDFDDYADDLALEVDGGWLRENHPDVPETASQFTITNPSGKRNPPITDGRPSNGKFLISDNDAGGGDIASGSGISWDIWSPEFSLEGMDSAWLHMDLSAQLNNNGTAIFDVDVSTDGGGEWTNAFRRIAPSRTVDPAASTDNAGGYFGRLDVDLSGYAGEPGVRVRVRHLEPGWDWWIALDNVIVDDVGPPNGNQDVLAVESFDAGIPATWETRSLIDPPNEGTSTWTTDDPGLRDIVANNGGVFPYQDGHSVARLMAPFAILDSDSDPDPAQSEYLITPSIDCSNLTRVYLHFKSEIVATLTPQRVLVSLDGGATFQEKPIFAYDGGGLFDDGEESFYAERSFCVPAAAGEPEVAFAFCYESAGNQWWWAVDDVRVSGDGGDAGVGPFIRGDCNGDGAVVGQVGDAVFILNYNFLGGTAPGCLAACDANGDGAVTGQVGDAVYILNFNFLGGAAPIAPFPDCGTSTLETDVALGCESPTGC